MNLVDANVLIYAVNEDAPNHAASREWLDTALSSHEPVGFTWVVLLAFLRLTTRAGLFARPLSVSEGTDVIAHWLAQPAAVVVEPTARHLEVLRGLLVARGTGANLVSDAHLAAIALETGASICSYDADFELFSGLRVTHP